MQGLIVTSSKVMSDKHDKNVFGFFHKPHISFCTAVLGNC